MLSFSHSCSPPIPPFPPVSTPPALLPCLSGYDDWGVFLLSFVVSVCVCVFVCACLPLRCAVSLSLPPGSEEPPSSRSVIGQGSGVLDTAWCWLLRDVFQQMVEVRKCHHIGERIRGERLSSRSCVVPSLLLKLKSQLQDASPFMSEGRAGEEREDRTKRGILALPLTLLSCRSGTAQLSCFFFVYILLFFILFTSAFADCVLVDLFSLEMRIRV